MEAQMTFSISNPLPLHSLPSLARPNLFSVD
jgi:hypothetical protein